MYLLGASLLRRRDSSFIHGAEHNTADLAAHLHHHLDARTERPRDGRVRTAGASMAT